MARERILIIDDKIEIIAFLVDLLQPLGYVLASALNGEEGLSKALKELPDLILLDLNMPGMSGMQVLEALHRHDCQSPVILMTLYGSESVAVQAFRLGVRNYIVKPFHIDELLAAIEGALEKGRLRRERERLVAELSEANRKLTQRMRELSALQAVGRSVASLMPKEQLLRRIIDAAIYLTGASAGALFLVDRDGHELRLEAVRQAESYDFGLQSRVRDSHAEDVLRTGQPLWISSPTKHTGVTAYLGPKVRTLLYVPMRSGGEILGVMGLVSLRDDHVLALEIQGRLTALADYAAIALQNTHLYEDSQRQAQRLATVNQIAQMIASSLDLKEIMWAVVHSLTESLHAETATLVLLDEERGELVFEVSLRGDVDKSELFRLKVGQGIVGWVIQTGQSVRVNDVGQDPRFYSGIDLATGFCTRSVLCVPLTVSDQVIGAIEAVNKLDPGIADGAGQFTDEDEELLRGAAAFVAIAVENARLRAAMRETIAAQTLHDTVVTLSHYVNNPLQTLVGAADLLRSELAGRCGEQDRTNGTTAQAIDLIGLKLQEISVVISVLRDIALPESTIYLGSEQMLDIEQELQNRLESIVHQS
jgi:GAF domain-containing protein/CheY-like chemotaxis protein